MHNLCRFGSYALETGKATLISTARSNSKRIYEDLENTNVQNTKQRNKGKDAKRKRCSRSEPSSYHVNRDNPRDASLILTALNAMEKPDSRCASASGRRGQSVNFASKTPQISNVLTPSENSRVPEVNLLHYDENPSRSNSKQSNNLPGGAPNGPDNNNNERQYIINVFLNDRKPKEIKEDCLDIHINDIDISSDEVCMHKLTENIHKSYTKIDQILNDNSDFNENRSELTKELKRVWSDVLKRSKVEEFELLKQANVIEDRDASKNDLEDELDESNLNNRSVITADEGLDRKDIEDDSERNSDEPIIVNPVITAAELDEVIKKNALYKKSRIKRNAKLLFEEQTQTEPKVEIKKAAVDAKQTEKTVEPTQIKLDAVPAEIVKSRTQPIVKDPVPIASAPIKEEVTQNLDKTEDIVEINPVVDASSSSKESLQNSVMKPQEAFDPEPNFDEFKISVLEKALTEQQINKYKANVAKNEPVLVKEPSSISRKFTKPREREIIDVLPEKTDELPSVTRPIPLTLGERLKCYNERTQKQIEDIVKMSALPPESQKTIKRVVTFCKDLLKDNQLNSRLSKFLQNDDFVDKKIGSKNVVTPENSTMNMRYSSYIQSQAKTNDQPNSNEENPDQSRMTGSPGSNEESFESFQQKCGVRERIMPNPAQQSDYYRMGQRRLSYSRPVLRGTTSTILRNRVACKRPFCSKSDKTEAGDDKVESKDDKSGPKDVEMDPNDPCSEMEAKAELKPCESRACKTEEDSCEPKKVNKCESPELIKQISEGVLGCTSKCLANRSIDESAEPEPQQEPCRVSNDPRYKQQVPPEEPKCDIMDQIGKYVSNEKDFEQVECYYGDNGYKNLEYFKYFPTSFYDINAYLSKERNPQPDANSHKKCETKKKKGRCNS